MSSNMIGDKLLHYEVVRLIGEGGMGTVFEGKHPSLDTSVAIKSLLPSFVSDNHVRQRFKQEAKTLQKLNHPNIVKLIDYVEDEKNLSLILEYVDGIELDKYIREVKGKVPHEEAVAIMSQVLDALSYAHSLDIVHRDIKPSNILIDKNNKVKIIDFGIAKMIDSDENLAKTMANQDLGTPRYMSPEQIKGEPVSFKTDIYSVGLVFYEMLTGYCPFDSVTNIYELHKKKIEEDLPNPREVYEFVPVKVDGLVMKAIEKNAEDRFKSCAEFKTLLEDKTLYENNEISVKLKVSGAKDPKIIFGKQGFRGPKHTISVSPYQKYPVSIWAEGKKIIDVEKSVDARGGSLEFTLEDAPGVAKQGLNLISSLSILVAISLLIGLAILYSSYQQVSSDNAELRQEINYYKNK